jgi:hypothetical protein
MRQGEGIMIYSDGTAIVGCWLHNKLEGMTLIFCPNGGVIYCEFINDMLNGWVIYEYQQRYLGCELYHLGQLK